MKKIILLLTLTFGLFQASNAQCTFTHTVSGNTATFTPTSFMVIGTTVIDSLVYDYGDGTGTFNIPLSQINNSHTYVTGGTYNVCHTYYMHQLGNPNNSFTCNYCDSVTIQGSSTGCFVNAGFNSSPGAGFTVNFTNTSSCPSCVTQTSYWDYGDGNNSTMAQGSHTYMTPGTYTVCLYQTGVNQNNITCIDTTCSVITVSQSSGCMTSISTSTTSNSITATGTATGGTAPYTYSYTLNPGNITNSTGVFGGLTSGVYTVCVTATDSMNNSCTPACDSASVGNFFPCSASIQSSANGNTVISTGSASGGIAPYTYSYTLNPGNITNNTGVFLGLANGAYGVCVTAIDAQNNTCAIDCDSAFVGVLTSPCQTFIQSSVSGNTITSSATAVGGNAPYTYSYNLNPGNITNSTGVFPGLPSGTYLICVTATDAQNDTCSIACDSAFVGGSTLCNTSIQSSLNGNTIMASATATGGSAPYSYSYTLYPGSITNSTGVFSGLTPGAYAVCATAFDAMQNICSTDCDSFIVSNTLPGGCVINAAFTETISGLTVNFTNSTTISNGTISNYGWSFGDGNISTVPSPTHTYAAAGPYIVVLVVNGYDSLQVPCVDSFSKTITVAIGSAVNDVKMQELNIYPNPTAKNITIDLPRNEKFEKLVITDVSGRIIDNNYMNIDNKKLTINLKNQSSGIYFIKLQTDKHIYTSSIMKQE